MYKTKLIAPILTGILLLTSCDSVAGTAPPQIDENLSLSCTLEYAGVEAAADFCRNDGNWTVSFTSPDSISGLTIACDKDSRNITYGGITFDYSADDVPFVTATDYIISCLDDATLAENVTVQEQDGYVKVSGSVAQSGYVITFDGNGSIAEISVGGVHLSV